MEEVVGAFDSAVGWAAGVVPVEDLVGPLDDGVGEVGGGVEIGEPAERLKGCFAIIGEVDAVELLERLPRSVEAGVFGEELIEAGLASIHRFTDRVGGGASTKKAS